MEYRIQVSQRSVAFIYSSRTHYSLYAFLFNPQCRLARSLGYPYIILSNNDVHVPNGVISGLADSLKYPQYPIVVPLTTRHACGHNPIQVVIAIR